LPSAAQVSGAQLDVAFVTVDKPAVPTLMLDPGFCKPVVVSGNVTQYGSQGLLPHGLAAPRL